MTLKFPEQFVLQGLGIIPRQIALITTIMSLDEIRHLKISNLQRGCDGKGSYIELKGILDREELYGVQTFGRFLSNHGLRGFKKLRESDADNEDRNLVANYNFGRHGVTLRVFPEGYDPKNLL